MPFSVILLEHDRFETIFCVVEDYHHVVELIEESRGVCEKFSLWYHKFVLNIHNSVLSWNEDLVKDQSSISPYIGFGLLLPLFGETPNNGDNKLFVLVFSN